MKFSHVLFLAAVVAAAPARAVYAPIPEQEQGKDLTVSIAAGWTYDSNIFGGATDAISSNVWEIAPRVTYNHSLTDQTFLSATLGIKLDDIQRRPGKKVLQSNDVMVRLAHAFSKSSTIDLSDSVMLDRNPQSLLNGVPLNTDQSFTRNEANGRYVAALTGKAGIEVKARSAYTKYHDVTLGRSLDHIENLYGVAGNYAILPELKSVAEYRHLDVYYLKLGELKNKHSNYVMGGFDYDVAEKLTLSSRLGAEWRHRAQGTNATAPYAELSGRYQYATQSFLTGGYGYSFDEPSDTVRFTDQKVNRFFLNVQHALTPLIVASLSADYEPAILLARPALGIANLHETARRFGGALSYMPTKNWIIAATYDLDRVLSDDVSRTVERHRAGLNASYTF